MEQAAGVETTFSTRIFKQFIPVAISLFTIVLLLVAITTNDWKTYLLWGEGEGSLVEIATVLFAFLGAFLALNNLFHSKSAPTKYFAPWMTLFILGFLYIGFEEASWGQHLFGWQTPDWLASANRQQETNIHNLFDKKVDRIPKTVLGALIVISGVFWPLYCRLKGTPKNLPHWFNALWPTKTTMTCALCFFIIWIIGRTLVITDLDIINGQKVHFSELRELLITYFLLVYTWELRRFRKV